MPRKKLINKGDEKPFDSSIQIDCEINTHQSSMLVLLLDLLINL